VGSVPHLFGLVIAIASLTCLVLALINNVQNWDIPANVDPSVRIAQYLSIFIALLMEEEIPTGLYLLRRVSKPCLKNKFPGLEYWRFACSSVLRVTLGYLFLMNVIIILAQADAVVEIFYDVLALQFIQQLDDIGYTICRMDVFGKRLRRATMTPYFDDEIENHENERLGVKWRMRVFLKGLYFVNLAVFLAVMIIVSVRQTNGKYQCESITIRFGDEVWEKAYVQWPESSSMFTPGSIEERVLVYSFFNGVYAKSNRFSEGRPIYVEQNKSDRTPFDASAPFDPVVHGDMDPIMPAEFRFCDGSWIFFHEYISKSKDGKPDDSGCDWLLRSPATDGFDLLEADGKWQIWTGVVGETEVSSMCNRCFDDSDCNLNGVCKKSNGTCTCRERNVDGIEYLGMHCEVKIEDECRTIVGEVFNDTWSLDTSTSTSQELTEIPQEYSRPVYANIDGLPQYLAPDEGNSVALMYSGSRWFNTIMQGGKSEAASDYWDWQKMNYHAFWVEAFSPDGNRFLSTQY